MIEFTNNTRWFGDLPNGTTITPGLIVTKNPKTGEEQYHNCYTLSKQTLRDWISKVWPELQEPEQIKPLSGPLSMMLAMMIVMMPLLILVMLVNMIGKMARTRAIDMQRKVIAHARPETV